MFLFSICCGLHRLTSYTLLCFLIVAPVPTEYGLNIRWGRGVEALDLLELDEATFHGPANGLNMTHDGFIMLF